MILLYSRHLQEGFAERRVAVCTLVFVASMVVLALSEEVQTGSLSTAGQDEELSRSIRQDKRWLGEDLDAAGWT